jgi:hypothetical protein
MQVVLLFMGMFLIVVFSAVAYCMQVFICLHLGFSKSGCSLSEGETYVEKKEHADSSQSFSSRISMSKESVIQL